MAADALSREEVIPGEWELSVQAFTSLVAQHGAELQVELFAFPLNHKLPVYFCPFPFPQARATDTLTQDWNLFQQVLVFPPPDLIKEVAKKLIAYEGGGVLVLQDSQTLLRFIPLRFLCRELALDPPIQRLYRGTVHPSKGCDRFRAWSF